MRRRCWCRTSKSPAGICCSSTWTPISGLPGPVGSLPDTLPAHLDPNTEKPMKPSLAPGATRTSKLTVDRDRTIGFMGENARVYATPMLVQDIEITCRDLLLEHLDA